MQSLTRQSPEDKRPAHQRINRTKPAIYGEAHLMMATRDTIVELRIHDDGSGSLVVKRTGVEIADVTWEAEKMAVIKIEGASKREHESL